MWLTAGGLLLTTLGVAATAGWLEVGRPRRLKRAGAKAQLWAAMPESPARDRLGESLEREVELYLRLEADRAYNVLTRLSYVTGLVEALSLLVGGVLWLVVNQSAHPSKASEIWLGVLTGLGLASIVASAVVERRLRSIRKQRAGEQAAESEERDESARATLKDLEEATARLTAAAEAARPWLEEHGAVLPPITPPDRVDG